MQEQLSKKELLAYAEKMRGRGDSWRSVHNFLSRQEVPDKLKKQIMAEVDEYEKAGFVPSTKVKIKNPPDFGFLISILLLAGGVFLTIFLWHKGIITTLTITMIAAGIVGLVKGGLKKRT